MVVEFNVLYVYEPSASVALISAAINVTFPGYAV
jgi:hypothetical protein